MHVGSKFGSVTTVLGLGWEPHSNPEEMCLIDKIAFMIFPFSTVTLQSNASQPVLNTYEEYLT